MTRVIRCQGSRIGQHPGAFVGLTPTLRQRVSIPRSICRSGTLFRFFDSDSSSSNGENTSDVSITSENPLEELKGIGKDDDRVVSVADDVDSKKNPCVLTLFRWPKHIPCDKVSLKGSFDGWDKEYPLTRDSASSDWTCALKIPPGKIYFKYLVDGRYVTSPSEPVVNESMSGTFNNIRLVHASAHFSWPTQLLGGSSVAVVGEWNSWEKPLELEMVDGGSSLRGKHVLGCCLPPGKYSYHFVVDGQPKTNPGLETRFVHASAKDYNKRVVNTIRVPQPPAVRIFYATGWAAPKLKTRWIAEDGSPVSDWTEHDLHQTTARCMRSSSGNQNGGSSQYNTSPSVCWKYAIVDCCSLLSQQDEMVTGSSSVSSSKPVGLEFIPFDPESGKEDRPAGNRGHASNVYMCSFPGGYKLQSGVVRPFNQACEPPMMLVSDIDGTLVGHDGAQIDSTERFGRYWEDRAALTGSFLVYNTGRSFGQVLGLLQHMDGILPVPDAIITAVGTKIFLLDREKGHRGTASGDGWHEDMEWARSLDEGWDIKKVQDAASSVIHELSEDHVKWLDTGNEHPHRIALNVHVDSVDMVQHLMREKLNHHGIHYKLICSGTMDWRYLDCVSGNAGKHAALERIRTLYGIAVDRCVAAGDSGNDILMLEGPNPAIVVGNAQKALVDWVVRQPQDGRIVVADATLADGVLEGLCRHQLY